MKKIIKLLQVSFILLTVVAAIFVVVKVRGDYEMKMMLAQKNAYTKASSGSVSNIGDVLHTVGTTSGDVSAVPVGDGRGRDDYIKANGQGQLITESVSTAESTEAVPSYSFADDMYPYRAMLTDTQKHTYDQIYDAAIEIKEEVKLVKQLDSVSINNVMTALYNDHPELYWLDTAYSYGYTSKGAVVSVTLKYNSVVDSLQKNRSQFIEAASSIINEASVLVSDEEKERYVYSRIQGMCVYRENSALNQSAFSAMVLGESVCAGYSRAFQYIMQQLNIPCYFVMGYANGGNHAWNIVKIDGMYYNVDLSWDDSYADTSGIESYSYYNMSDKVFSVDHQRTDLSINLPLCE